MEGGCVSEPSSAGGVMRPRGMSDSINSATADRAAAPCVMQRGCLWTCQSGRESIRRARALINYTSPASLMHPCIQPRPIANDPSRIGGPPQNSETPLIDPHLTTRQSTRSIDQSIDRSIDRTRNRRRRGAIMGTPPKSTEVCSGLIGQSRVCYQSKGKGPASLNQYSPTRRPSIHTPAPSQPTPTA